ncbi:unnamed protein product [Ostreobium quekettii]|uniref:Uncharacterized protein n=1 Tax=Ostreobium quekettii TaxID=121088 RepID=A0A8S1J5N7_9CHLO|nr:unnamed protein product [Ostreobium quekettii]|eukprot:evm.model.scf_2277.2 EVM.evm.TU.scf_2277.2   scf_2277:9994-13344(+)
MDACESVPQIEMLKGNGNVSSWNNHTEVVRGTDGARFHPWVKDNETVTVWMDELFRAVTLSPTASVHMDGIRLLRFELEPSMMKPDPRFFQYIEGLFNVTSPMGGGVHGPPGKPGLPVYYSLPHYCHAAANLTKGVNGLACNSTQHELYIDVEPVTGEAWRTAKRLMMSSEFGPGFKTIDAKLNRTVLPIFWVENAAQASQSQATVLNDEVFKIQKAKGLSGSLPFLMAALLASCVLYIVFGMFIQRKQRRTSVLMWGSAARMEQTMDAVVTDRGVDVEEPLIRQRHVVKGQHPPPSPEAGPSSKNDAQTSPTD